MKKQRSQPAFATLTEAEIEELACMLQRETYATVLERIRKPRSEGGFDLHISVSPLERLLDKKNKLDLINARLAREHRKLTLAELNTITSGEIHAAAEVHQAILSATYDLATSGDNTPHQLLALQRLADFPARAELREQTIAHREERQQFARAKEQRDQAKTERDHAKAQRAAVMQDHKIEMDHFRREATLDRLKLTRERLELLKLRLDPSRQRSSHDDHDDSFDADEWTDSDCEFADPDTSEDRSESQPLHNPAKDNAEEAEDTSGSSSNSEIKWRFPKSPFPPEVMENNRRFAEKLLAGLADGTIKYTDDYVANRNVLKEYKNRFAKKPPVDPSTSLPNPSPGLDQTAPALQAGPSPLNPA